MKEPLYDELVDSIVKILQESPYELKKFVIDKLENERELKKFKKGVKKIDSYSHSVAVSIILDDLLGREF